MVDLNRIKIVLFENKLTRKWLAEQLGFYDKPMIPGEQTVIKAAQTLCSNGMLNIGIGQPRY